MAIHTVKNLYPAIDIHLNSLLQNEPGGWRSFDSQHVIDLARNMDTALPQGYFTRSKSHSKSESLIREAVSRAEPVPFPISVSTGKPDNHLAAS